MSDKKLKKLTLDLEEQIQVSVDKFVEIYGEYFKKTLTQNLIISLENQFQSCVNCEDSVLIGFGDVSFGFDDVEPEEFKEMCQPLMNEHATLLFKTLV